MKKILFPLCLGLFVVNATQAQKKIPLNWHMLDFNQDSIYGISANRAYDELLKGKTSTQVIVAVVDSGADTTHQDLKNVLWHNPNEIPGDNKDNDRDGLVDDVYGWNYLGGNNDTVNVTKDSYVVDRFYAKYRTQFQNITNAKQVKRRHRGIYQEWLKSKELALESTPQQKEINQIDEIIAILPRVADFKKLMLKESFTAADVKAYEPIDQKTNAEKQIYSILFSKVPAGTTNLQLVEALSKVKDSLKTASVLPTTAPTPYRANVVKDDPNNFKDRDYGNKNVMAGDVMHGTHVSGIIGAERNNNIGMDGVADNVKIMELRAVPDGDEHDKDIALSIIYAVDHGAKVINMSFGKGLSPKREWVEKAFEYARKHDVLLVHAAGNSSTDITNKANYPTQFYGKNDKKSFDNMITVGASGPVGPILIAGFTNFSPKAVDVFAPGVRIYSTLPTKDNYGQLSGTSMASPVVAGVAAVLRSYFPKLTAPQVKNIIMQSVTKIDFPVIDPATHKKVTMTDLCIAGGVVNLYNAIKLAEKMSK